MAARPNEAKLRRRSVVRLIHPTVEIVPVSIDAGARGISRRSRLLGYLDGPASRASHLTADRASRGLLNGFPGLLAGVLGCRVGEGHRRPWDRSPQGLSDAAKVGKPAYSPWPHFACPQERLAGGLAPSDPRNGNGAP